MPTLCRDKQEARLALAALPKPPFIVKENRIWTCSYLPAQDCALRAACADSEEVRITPAIEWLEDPAKQLWFVELLNSCVQKYCARLGLIYDFKHKRFYCPPKDGKEWWFSYQSVQQAARRRPAYPSIGRDSGRIRFWVHQSARLRFERLGPNWFLKIIPGYVFTEDGHKFLTAGEVGRVTTGKKARERNLVVLRTLMFWRDFLSGGDSSPRGSVARGSSDIRIALAFARSRRYASEERSVDLCDRDIEMSHDSTGLPCTHAARSPGSCHAGSQLPDGAARALEFF